MRPLLSSPAPRPLLCLALLCASLALSGCASSLSGSSYSREQTRREMVVRTGVVEQVRDVQIEGTRSSVGATSGAVIGGVAGSTVGGGRGSIVAAVLGAVLGGMAGSAIEEGGSKVPGQEITVRIDQGPSIAIVQETDAQDGRFNPGDRVRILTRQGQSRVAR